ncbi:MAG: hypothetical protein LBC63_03405 [Holophagales bacterium]|nr:hypothetical protein [Holophagales bacterium]
MAERKPFLLRLDPALLEALQRWAADEMRSLNGQIEYCLKNSLKNSGRENIALPVGNGTECIGCAESEASRPVGR